MPFIAEKSNNTRIDITEYATPKLQIDTNDLRCPYCHTPFNIVHTESVMAHFRHKERCTDEVAQAYFSGETDEHRQAKKFLKELFVQHLAGYSTIRPELEVHDPSCNRIADIMISYPFGYRQAIEAQFSRVDLENIKARTLSYFESGIDVVWFLGPQCRDERIREFLQNRLGVYYYIDNQEGCFSISETTHYINSNGEINTFPNSSSCNSMRLWKDIIRLCVVRYLQVYGRGFAPHFAEAINGTQLAEKLFGANLGSLKKRGAVEGTPKTIPDRQHEIKLWKVIDGEIARQWANEHKIHPMPEPAKELIKSKNNFISKFDRSHAPRGNASGDAQRRG
jgi:hypothetical protein